MCIRDSYEFRVVWRGAGEEIAYVSLGAEGRQVRLMDLPTGEETLLHRSGDVNSWPYDFSPDGSTLLIGVQAAGAAVDLYLLTVGSDEPLRPFLESPATKLSAEFSPNGRWIAYASDETGQFEVHMRSYPDGVERRVVSIAGGVHPRFAADGSAIFYSSGPDVLRVPVLDANTMRLGAPEAFVTGVDGDAWEVLADGSAVIAVAPRAMPELRVILDATSLFESR